MQDMFDFSRLTILHIALMATPSLSNLLKIMQDTYVRGDLMALPADDLENLMGQFNVELKLWQQHRNTVRMLLNKIDLTEGES